MTTRLLNVLLRTALLVAVVASAAMFMDYRAASPAFCGVQSGCSAVRDSAYSSVFGVSLPTIGIGTFVGLFAMALWASRKTHLRMLAVQTALAATGALALIGIQLFVVDAVCLWCMAVDISAIVAAGATFVLYRREPDDEPLPEDSVASAEVVLCRGPRCEAAAGQRGAEPGIVARNGVCWRCHNQDRRAAAAAALAVAVCRAHSSRHRHCPRCMRRHCL